MKHVSPQVFCLAETKLNKVGVQEFLNFHKIHDWKTDAKTDAETLIEIAGRRCYQSWETESRKVSEVNANLSMVRVGNERYLGNIIKSKHGSVLEHATTTFAIENVSRVFTHEMVRHRLCAVSQESLRFVRPTQLKAWFPNVFNNLPKTELEKGVMWDLQEKHGIVVKDTAQAVKSLFNLTFEHLEDVQKILVDLLGMDTVKRAFGEKKKLQSAFRRLMPIGMATGIIITSNHRNLRHLIDMRTNMGAEEEMRIVFANIASYLEIRYPAIYQDMTAQIPEDGIALIYTFEHEKI